MKRHQVSFPTSDKRDSFSHSTHSATSDYNFADPDDEEEYQQERQQSRTPLFDGVDPGKTAELTDNRRLSWFTASTGDIYAPLHKIVKEDPLAVDKFKVLLRPPEFDHDDILCAVHSFMKSLADYIPSIKHDKTFDTVRAIRKLVSEEDSVRLYGLLTHYCYWNIIYPVAKKVMHDLRSAEPRYHLFDGLDLIHGPEDRTKLPKALRTSLNSGNEAHHPLVNGNKVTQTSNSSNKSYDGVHQLFQQGAKQPQLHQHELDVHVEDALQQANDYQSDAGLSSHDDDNTSVLSNVSLTLQEKENLYVQLETCILTIFRKMGKSKYSLVVGRQALISCCHIVTDEILTTIYPWFALLPEEFDDELEDKNEFGDRRNLHVAQQLRIVNQRLRRLLHQSLSDLIDPSRAYTSLLLIRNFVGSSRYTSRILAAGKQSRLLATSRSLTKANRGGTNNLGGKGKYYRTSAAVIALFGDTKSYEARTFLQRGSALYAPIPGSVQPFTTRLRRLQEAEQRAKEEEAARKRITWEKLLTLADMNNITHTHPENIPLRSTTSQQSNKPTSSSSQHRPVLGSPLQMNPPRAISPFSPVKQHASTANPHGIAPPLSSHASSRAGSSSGQTRNNRQNMIHVKNDQMPMPWQARPLDFSRLFEEQPEAYYKPIKLFDPKYAPGRPRNNEDENDDRRSSDGGEEGEEPFQIQAWHDDNNDNDNNNHHNNNHRHKGGSKNDANLNIMTSFPFSPAAAAGANSHTSDHRSHPLSSATSGPRSSALLRKEFRKFTAPVGHLEDQNSYTSSSSSVSYASGDDPPSIAHNSLAPLPISLRAKSALMTLMVDKSSRAYKAEQQTQKIKLRISLLAGGNTEALSTGGNK